jgi:hypothetical protein
MAHRLERFVDRWSTLRSARSPSWLIWAMRWLRAATARPRPRWRLTQMDAEPEAALMMLERKQKHRQAQHGGCRQGIRHGRILAALGDLNVIPRVNYQTAKCNI